MSKPSTIRLIERAQLACSCESCLTCAMAKRLTGHLGEIRALHKMMSRGIARSMEQHEIQKIAIRYLKENRPACALGVLRGHIGNAEEILKELANGEE